MSVGSDVCSAVCRDIGDRVPTSFRKGDCGPPGAVSGNFGLSRPESGWAKMFAASAKVKFIRSRADDSRPPRD
jgi:hypothetical protein